MGLKKDSETYFFTYEDNKSSLILLQKHYVTLVHISEHTIGKTKKIGLNSFNSAFVRCPF
jgi:hypothetical protein